MEMEDGSSSDESQSTIHSKNELNGNVGQDSSGGGVNHRNPTCALCRNHQRISSLKGHKRYCPWRQCLCELCYSTNKKREINAKQVAMRRAQAQDEALGLNQKEVEHNKVNEYNSAAVKPASAFSAIEPTNTSHSSVAAKLNVATPSYRDEHPKSVNCNISSSTQRPATNCQPGPAIFGQQLSLGSIILGQNASMLRESITYSRLGPELVSFLEQMVNDVKMTTEEILYQLNEIQKDLHIRILREQVSHPRVDATSYSTLPFVQESLARVVPTSTAPVNPYSIPLMYQSQYRTTVISAPRLEYQNAVFNPHTSL